MRSDSYLTPYTIINSKDINNLNIINETIKLLEVNIEVNRYDFAFHNEFFERTSKA